MDDAYDQHLAALGAYRDALAAYTQWCEVDAKIPAVLSECSGLFCF
jgi:hypothetical protein